MILERLDLHGYTVDDALFRFWQRYKRLLADRQGQTQAGEMWGLEVIHGKGTAAAGGLIREALRDYLKANATRVKGFDIQLILRDSYADLGKYRGRAVYFYGEDIDRNGGKTVVVPREMLPRPGDLRPYR